MLRFGAFSFDPGTLQLEKSGVRVELRPKTAMLLRALLEGRDAVIAKRELINTVWQSDIVPDQSLFQAISELRRALAPMTPIKTIPNHGYQWTAPLRQRTAARAALAAGAIAATIAAVTLLSVLHRPAERAPATALSPALAAFATGIGHLERDDPRRAEHYFRLSHLEDPEFSEAQLLLSEALLRQGKTTEAREIALSLIATRSSHHDAYAAVTAMDLVSRAELQAGQNAAAASWAAEATDRAVTEGFVCAAIDFNERLRNLLAMAGGEAPAVQVARLPAEKDSTHCEQLRAPVPETGRLDPGFDYDTRRDACFGRHGQRLTLV